MEQYTGLDRKLERMARFFIRRRRIGVLLQVVIAALCIWSLFGLRLRDDPNAGRRALIPMFASTSGLCPHSAEATP